MKTYLEAPIHSRYEFSLEKPTQSLNKTVLIKQDSQGLNLLVQEEGHVTQVEKHLIEGLPKEFFDSCHVRVANIEDKKRVYFSQNLKGGMQNDLIDTIRSNIENDYEEELSEEDLDLVMKAFGEIISKESKEEQEKVLTAQLEKFNNLGKPHLGKALIYGLERAEGKYAFFLLPILGTYLAKYAYNRGKQAGWW